MASTIPSLLLLGAFSPEIHLLAESLQDRIIENLPPADGADSFAARLEILEVGVGNQSAAFHLQKRLSRIDSPPVLEAIFIGSAGIYGTIPEFRTKDPEKGDPHPKSHTSGFSRIFWNRELAVMEGRSRVPDIYVGRVETVAGPLGSFLQEKLAPLAGETNSPDSITLADPLVEGISLPEDMLFENMEAFGLGYVASRLELPFSALFALTNRVGPEGSREWARNHQEYSIQLQNSLLKAMEGHFLTDI